MIIALLALALAMILGGLFTIFLGWDIVLVERGWTMVLAGSISAAGGALLLGITAAVSKLARIQAELARLHGAFQGGSPYAAMPLAPVEPSAAALPGGILGAAAAGPTEAAADRDEIEPLLPFPDRDRPAESLGDEEAAEGPSDRSPASEHAEAVVPFRPRIYAGAPSSPEEEPLGAKVPEFLLGDRFRDSDEEASTPEPDVSLPAAEPVPEEPEEKPEPVVDAAEDVTSAAWPAPEAEVPEAVETAEPAVSSEPEPEAVPEEPRPVTIVGTYNSGDNRYVMFSDGSIEAQTPGGVFRFNSLDELKEFIASGGEGGSTAA
jgi:hypothetical protein